jgi:uncharacterized protein
LERPRDFETLKTRQLALFFLISTVGYGVVLAFVSLNEVLGGILINLALLLWVVWKFRRNPAAVGKMIGPLPKTGRAWLKLWVVVPLFLFSLGAYWLLYFPLSFVAPSFVEAVLDFEAVDLSPTSALHNFTEFLSLVVVAPLVEEIVFRGVLLHRWAAKGGLPRAIIATSAIFGAFRIDPLGAGMFGAAMAVLYLRTGSLILPMACHALHNGFVFSYALMTMGSDEDFAAAYSLQHFQSDSWFFAACLILSLPGLIYFFRRRTGAAWGLPDLGPPAALTEEPPAEATEVGRGG